MCSSSPSPAHAPATVLPPMGALDILRESIRLLRSNPSPFLSSLSFLILPTSVSLLSSPLLLPPHLPLLSPLLSSLPPHPLLLRLSLHLLSSLLSSLLSLPLLLSLLLAARSAVAFSVASSYASRPPTPRLFLSAARRFWRRPLLTYLFSLAALSALLALFLALLLLVSGSLSCLGYPPDIVLWPALLVFLGFAVAYAHTIIVCNLAVVISVLEDASGLPALARAVELVRGQTQPGLLIFLGTTIGLAFVEGLFEHRVKTLSYGDGSSRIWEGPLLVVMYSFVVLVDSMMSAVFYFSCRSTGLEEMGEVLSGGEEESDPLVHAEGGLVEMHSIK